MLLTGPGKKNLIAPVFFRKNFGGNVNGPEIFFARTGSVGNYFLHFHAPNLTPLTTGANCLSTA